ncbi:MAG: sulfatase, partial [Pirellulaceae bacterium]|nr:sulfatase [Pirellulaceae bacterium]
KPQYMFGFRGRMDERYDFIRTVTDGRFHYIRNFNPHFIYGQHVNYNFVTPSTSAWKRDFDAGKLNEAQSHFWGLKPAEELYDLQADPDEVHNLAESAGHRRKLAELRNALRDWCHAIRDVGFLPEGEIHSRSAGSTPYEMARDDARYPLARIYAAADMATRRDEDDLPQLRNLAKDKDSAVRYWGVVGILNRGAGAVKSEAPLLSTAMEDQSPYVRVAAAYALGKYGDASRRKRAVETLLAAAAWESERSVFEPMAALNALDKLDAKAAYALPRIKKLPRGGGSSPDRRYNGYVGRLLQKTVADLE